MMSLVGLIEPGKIDYIRRAHVDVVDVREYKRSMDGSCMFISRLTNGGPIYGFDIIAGKNKGNRCFSRF